jgi:hypothetical protein
VTRSAESDSLDRCVTSDTTDYTDRVSENYPVAGYRTDASPSEVKYRSAQRRTSAHRFRYCTYNVVGYDLRTRDVGTPSPKGTALYTTVQMLR